LVTVGSIEQQNSIEGLHYANSFQYLRLTTRVYLHSAVPTT
jgi:hypothetical protein